MQVDYIKLASLIHGVHIDTALRKSLHSSWLYSKQDFQLSQYNIVLDDWDISQYHLCHQPVDSCTFCWCWRQLNQTCETCRKGKDEMADRLKPYSRETSFKMIVLRRDQTHQDGEEANGFNAMKTKLLADEAHHPAIGLLELLRMEKMFQEETFKLQVLQDGVYKEMVYWRSVRCPASSSKLYLCWCNKVLPVRFTCRKCTQQKAILFRYKKNLSKFHNTFKVTIIMCKNQSI